MKHKTSVNFSQLTSIITQTNFGFKQHTEKSIDKLLTIRNWLIGAFIFEFEQNGANKAKYGSKLEEKLADKINLKGLSARNLKLFKQFYKTYPQLALILSSLPELPLEIMQTVSASLPFIEKNSAQSDYLLNLIQNLSFSHFVELLKIEETPKREFYENLVMQSTLSVRELKRKIDHLTFERISVAKNKSKLITSFQKKNSKENVSSILKTPYIFDFLGLSDQTLASESQLENALLADLKNFMLELGHGFCFEAQQKRIVIGGDYYFVDLVFYHRILKCHILIELKIDSFKHEHAGQLNTYLQYYKKNIQDITDNPPIGILLCTNQNASLVEYALGGMDNNLFVSQYKTVLPSQKELTEFLENEKDKHS